MARRVGSRRIVPGVSAVIVIGLVVSAAFLSSGFRPIESSDVTSNVWISKGGGPTSDGATVGRVNLAAGEIDSYLSQGDTESKLWTVGASTVGASGSTLFVVNDASPQIDVGGDKVASADQMDVGIVVDQVAVGGPTALLFSTSDGQVRVGGSRDYADLTSGLRPIDVDGTIAAAQVSTSGIVYLLVSTGRGYSVVTFDRSTSTLATLSSFAATFSPTSWSLAVVGDTWCALGRSATQAVVYTQTQTGGTDLTSALGVTRATDVAELEQRSASGTRALVAVSSGLVSVPLDAPSGATAVPIDGITSGATASTPTSDANGCVVAAWVTAGAQSGAIATVCADDTPGVTALSTPSALSSTTATALAVRIRGAGDNLVVNEVASGHAWRRDGNAIASAWSWTDPDANTQAEETATSESQPPAGAEPPVARDDAFTIRPGRTSIVPVLLNDFDPNGDPFYITQVSGKAPSVTSGGRLLASASGGVDDGLSVVNNGRELAVTVPAASTAGEITLHYWLTDGTSSSDGGGLYSVRPGEVTLTIINGTENSDPVLSQDANTQVSVSSGGSAVVDVLSWWQDPDLDPLVVSSVAFVSDTSLSEAAVTVQSDGTLLFRHFGTGTGPYVVSYLVADGHGGTAEGTLTFSVSTPMTATNFALSGETGTPVTVDLTSWVHGAPVAASVKTGETDGAVTFRDGLFGFLFTASTPGDYRVTYTVVGNGSVTARVLIHVVDASAAHLTVTPITVTVRANEYQTVDVNSAISGAGSTVPLVTSVATAKKKVDAAIRDYRKISLITNDSVSTGEAGTIIDTITYTVKADDGAQARGEISVYLSVAETDQHAKPVVRDDTVTVASGAQVDIPVLDNDRDPNGGALSLNAAWTSESPTGSGSTASTSATGIYFPSGTVLRYLAPTVSSMTSASFRYQAVGSNGEKESGTVYVTIVPTSKIGATSAPDLTARVNSKGTVSIAAPTVVGGVMQQALFVDTSGLDGSSTGVATISSDRLSITYAAPAVDDSRTISFTYRLQVGTGEPISGTVRVGVTKDAGTSIPLAVTDFVSVKAGREARVDPLANDVPSDRTATLSLEKITLADKTTRAYAYQEGTTDDPTLGSSATTSAPTVDIRLAEGTTGTLVITPRSGLKTATVTLGYRVTESGRASSAGRIVVNFVTGDVNLYPVVADTTVTSKDYDSSGTNFSVDVVAGKVAWSSGDPATLSIEALPNAAAAVSITGHTVTGLRPRTTERITLKFSGSASDAEHTPIVSYAFLIIVSEDDEVPSVASSTATRINAGDSHTFTLADDVVWPTNSEHSVVSVTERTGQGTAALQGDTIVYRANDDGGGYDSLRFVVSYVTSSGQKSATLAFPIFVVAKAPMVTVQNSAFTIAPGDILTTSLLGLTSPWEGTDDQRAALPYTVTTNSAAAASTQFARYGTGATLAEDWSIEANATATVGETVTFVLTVTGQSNSDTAEITVAIVSTTRSNPKAQTCAVGGIALTGDSWQRSYDVTQTDSAICSGGYNPFADASGDTGLTVASLSYSGRAPNGVAFTASGGSITASVANPSDPSLDGTVTVYFTVKDANGRPSSNTGSLTLSFLIRPAQPTLVLSAYDTDGVTLGVRDGGGTASADTYVLESRSSSGGTWAEEQRVSADVAQFSVTNFGDGGPASSRDFRVYAINSSPQPSDISDVLAGVYAQATPNAPATLTWAPDTSTDDHVTLTIGNSGTTAESWTISGGTSPIEVTKTSAATQNVDVLLSSGQSTLTVSGKTVACGPCQNIGAPTISVGSKTVTATAFGTPSVSDIALDVDSGKVTFTPTMNGPDPANPGYGFSGTASWNWTYCVSVVSSLSGSPTCTPSMSGVKTGTISADAAPQTVSIDIGDASTKYAVVTVSNGKNTRTAHSDKATKWLSSAAITQLFSYTIGGTSSTSSYVGYVPKVVSGDLPAGFTFVISWGSATLNGNSGSDWSGVTLNTFTTTQLTVQQCTGGDCQSSAAATTLSAPDDVPVAFLRGVSVALNDTSTCEITTSPATKSATATASVVTTGHPASNPATVTQAVAVTIAAGATSTDPLVLSLDSSVTLAFDYTPSGGTPRQYQPATDDVTLHTCTP